MKNIFYDEKVSKKGICKNVLINAIFFKADLVKQLGCVLLFRGIRNWVSV
jgi:hypothetical protein